MLRAIGKKTDELGVASRAVEQRARVIDPASKLREVNEYFYWERKDERGLALALVTRALEQLPLLVLAHLLAPLLDDVAQGALPQLRIETRRDIY